MDRYNNMSSQAKALTCETISISEMEKRRLLLEDSNASIIAKEG